MAHYFDLAQQQHIRTLARSFTGRTQWPTWLLLIAVPGAWFGLLFISPLIGAFWTILLLIPVVVLWMSVQHELLHGHPTRALWFNKLLGYAPFAVWYPYTLYRDSHLLHHRDHDLTLPGIDPESRYLLNRQWPESPKLLRGLLWLRRYIHREGCVTTRHRTLLVQLMKGMLRAVDGAHAIVAQERAIAFNQEATTALNPLRAPSPVHRGQVKPR